jgi:hypothetical protein
MDIWRMLRIIAALLLFAFGALYAMSRTSVAPSSDPNGVHAYIARHSIYWLILAGAAGVKWIFVKFFPNIRQ